MARKNKPATRVNQTGSGIHKDKRTKRNRSRSANKSNAINESREERDAKTRVTKPSQQAPYTGKKTNATQWNRWTP